MTTRLALLAILTVGVGTACSGQSVAGGGLGGGGSSGAAMGSGGSSPGGSGGSSSTGGMAAGGGVGTSPGTATLVLEVQDPTRYCYTTDFCSQATAITIADASGKAYGRYAGMCYTPCDTCELMPCPGMACMPQGFAFAGETLTWDGTYYESDVCGAGTSCTAHRYAPAGTYVATLCATPGTLAPDELGQDACTPTGAAECVELTFELPSSETYTATLPP